MKMKINESPDELKGSQAGSKASEGKNEVANYIEIEPSLPTFHMDDGIIAKVIKWLFNPENAYPEKMIVEFHMGFCLLDYYIPDNFDEFNTIYGHPDTVSWYPAEHFLEHCNMDVDMAIEEFGKWGITKVALGHHINKTVKLKPFFEAIVRRGPNYKDDMVISCDDGTEIHFFNSSNGEEKEKTE